MATITIEDGDLASISLAVITLTGEESVNDLFEFTAVVAALRTDLGAVLAAGAENAADALIGARVHVTLDASEPSGRRFGRIVDARYEGLSHNGNDTLARFQLRVAPTAWVLTQQRRSRIFQRLYLHEIVGQVLGQSGVRHRWSLSNRYPRRVYCVQYDETDWQFVMRLLAEEGVFFYFEHTESFEPDPPEPDGDDRGRTLAGSWITAGADLVGEFGDVGLAPVAGVAGIVGDLIQPEPEDPDATPLIVPGSGAAGPTGAGDVLVFGDEPSAYDTTADPDALDPSAAQSLVITRREDSGMVITSRTALEYSAGSVIRPRQVEIRDYDFRRPLTLLQATAPGPRFPVDAIVDWAPATRGESSERPEPREIYAHHGEYETPDIDAQNARQFLEQHRTRAKLTRVVTNCTLLLPGSAFTLHNDTTESIAEGDYVPIRIRHDIVDPTVIPGDAAGLSGAVRGAARAIYEAFSQGDDRSEADLQALIRRAMLSAETRQRIYENHVECLHSTVPARPPRPKREPRTVTESATVVGPRGEDIHTDRFGRIKVQFHWDRTGQWNEESSCWVRVTQPWSGAGYGFQFVPRVGMEVLIAFLAGDPDRPVVTGTLNNGTHETPEPLPQRKTRSAIRTQSTPGGLGFNELAFEDSAGTERILLHAQKDFEQIVNDSHTLTVRGDETVSIGSSQSLGVAENQRTSVGGDQSTLVGENQSTNVSADRTVRVGGTSVSQIEGAALHSIAGARVESVRGDAMSVVEGSRVESTHGDLRLTVGANKDSQMPRIASTHVHGYHATVAHAIWMRAVDLLAADEAHGTGAGTDPDSNAIILQCGDSILRISRSKIEITARELSLIGTEQLSIEGPSSSLQLTRSAATLRDQHGNTIALNRGGASVTGSSVSLRSNGSSASPNSSPAEPPNSNVKLALTWGPATAPRRLANVPYLLIFPTDCGEGTTSAQGEIEFYASPVVSVMTVRLIPNASALRDYPGVFAHEHDALEFTVRLEEEIPEQGRAEQALALARFRLRNLGYEPDTNLHNEDLDGSTRSALRRFQRDANVDVTGEPDEATRGALRTAWEAT